MGVTTSSWPPRPLFLWYFSPQNGQVLSPTRIPKGKSVFGLPRPQIPFAHLLLSGVDGICRDLPFKPAKYGSNLCSLAATPTFLVVLFTPKWPSPFTHKDSKGEIGFWPATPSNTIMRAWPFQSRPQNGQVLSPWSLIIECKYS